VSRVRDVVLARAGRDSDLMHAHRRRGLTTALVVAALDVPTASGGFDVPMLEAHPAVGGAPSGPCPTPVLIQ
jgi:hypothetical protein